MPGGIPTAYTEGEIAAYMITSLTKVAGVLEWTASSGEVLDAVIETLLAYFGEAGAESTIDHATDIRKLRVLARRAIWRAAVVALGTEYTFSTDGQSFQRSDMAKYASAMLATAEADAAAFDTGTAQPITMMTLRYPADPYIVIPPEERTA